MTDVGDLRASAAAAGRRGDPIAAARILQHALRSGPASELVPELLGELAEAELATMSERGFERMHEAIAATADPVARARLALQFARPLLILWRTPEAVEVLSRARRELGDADPALRAILTGELVAAAAGDLATADIAGKLFADQAAMAEAADDPAVLGLQAAGAVGGGTDPEQATELAERALADARALSGESASAIALATLALIWSDRLERPREIWTRALTEANSRGDALAAAYSRAYLCYIELRAGELGKSVTHGRASLDALRRHDLEAKAFPVAPLAEALLWQGEYSEAAEMMADADELVGAATHVQACFLLRTRGLVRLAAGDTSAGVEDLLVCGRRCEAAGLPSPAALEWCAEAAVAELDLGERSEGLALAEQALEAARTKRAPARALGGALRARALAGTGSRARLLSKAVKCLESSPGKLELARALADHGAALAESGRLEQAREQLRRALDLSHRLGAIPLADRSHRALIAAGGRPRRTALSGPEALTPAQRRVADLAASGMSNREIANRLVVTIRTIEVHLNRAFRKLGVASRDQLSAVLEKDSR